MDDEPLVARRLDPGDIDAALRLWQFDIDADVLARELSPMSGSCWMGLYTAGGALAALHRGLRWHRYLLLKGLCVRDPSRAPAAALRAAFAIRDWAHAEGLAGVAAWVEPNRAESQLAHRLRIRTGGPLVHRYLVPLPPRDGGRIEAQRTTGTLDVAEMNGLPVVGELLGVAQGGARGARLAWTLDRARLVLSGNPCSSVEELDTLVNAAAELVPVTGATAVEVPFAAADLHSALRLVGTGGKRLSRSPVRLGIARFQPKPPPASPDGRP